MDRLQDKVMPLDGDGIHMRSVARSDPTTGDSMLTYEVWPLRGGDPLLLELVERLKATTAQFLRDKGLAEGTPYALPRAEGGMQ